MSINVLLERLEKVKAMGRSSWKARCPAHDDKDPSLRVTQAANGNVLIHCFAGCTPNEIVDAVGLDIAALFSDDYLNEHRKLLSLHRHGQKINREKEKSGVMTRQEKAALILELAKQKRKEGEKLTDHEMEIERRAYMFLRSSS